MQHNKISVKKDINFANKEKYMNKDEKTSEENKNFPNRYFVKVFILYFQIFSSAIILLSVLALKQFNPPIFANIKDFYNKNVNILILQDFDIKKSMEFIDKKFLNKLRKNIVFKNKDNEILKGNNAILFTVPVSKPLNEGVVTSRFGLRKDPFTSQDKLHLGLDIGANNGEIIHAILPGTVVKTEKSNSYGNYVKLDHGNNIESIYAHCEEILVSEGDVISRGQGVASVGRSGRATGNHLHLEILVNGIKQNPEIFLENAYV